MPLGLFLTLLAAAIVAVAFLVRVAHGLQRWLGTVDACPECEDGTLKFKALLPPLPGKDGVRRAHACDSCGYELVEEVSDAYLQAEAHGLAMQTYNGNGLV